MQDNPYLLYPCYQESSSSQHSGSANNNFASPTDIIMSTSSESHQWSSAVAPVVGNDDSLLTAFSDTAESIRCATHAPFPQTAWDTTFLPTSLSHYSIDTHFRPWLSTAETSNTRAYAPPTWSNVSSMQPNRSQVPSGATDPNIFGRTWSHSSIDYHAVGAPAQPPSLCEIGLYMPFHEAGASYRSTSQIPTTSFGGLSSWTAQSTLIQAPPLSRQRRHTHRSHALPDRVICDKCQKSMRPQSLKRHVKEVHDRIKRHTKRGFAAEP